MPPSSLTAPSPAGPPPSDPALPALFVPPGPLLVAGRPLAQLPGLTLRAGVVLHLQGPNGAGKTTLLRALAGEQAGVDGARVAGGVPGSRTARAATA